MNNVDATIAESDRIEPVVSFEAGVASSSLEKEEVHKSGDNIDNTSVGTKLDNEQTNKSIADDNKQATNERTNAQNKHILGKFDSVEMLEKAYQSLQAEFTRKSQELASIKNRSNSEDNSQQEFDKFEEFSKQFKKDDEFIQKVAQEFLKDDKLIKDKLGLTQAVYNVMSDKIKENEKNLQSNEWVYEFVNSNESIKQKIINDYINNCAKGKIPPLMVNTFGTNMVASTPSTPTTLEEVANIMNKWLNN